MNAQELLRQLITVLLNGFVYYLLVQFVAGWLNAPTAVTTAEVGDGKDERLLLSELFEQAERLAPLPVEAGGLEGNLLPLVELFERVERLRALGTRLEPGGQCCLWMLGLGKNG